VDVQLRFGDLLRRDSRRREELHHVAAGESLESPRICDLVQAAAYEQVAGQRAGGWVIDCLVDLQLVVARSRFEEEVVSQVFDQVARREHEVAVPGTPLGVLRKRRSTTGEPVMRVADTDEALQTGCAATRPRLSQHRVDSRGNELDVAELLSRDRAQQIVERPSSLPRPKVERLERV